MAQVLLAHLGEILMDNSSMLETVAYDVSENVGRGRKGGGDYGTSQDLLNLSLTNMNLFSVTLQPDVLCSSGTTSMSAHLSELTQRCGVPILYDTSVGLIIGKREVDIPFINPDVSAAVEGLLGMPSPRKMSSPRDIPNKPTTNSAFLKSISSVLDVRAKISSPLKLSLCKEVYEQILQTTDNLTYDADNQNSNQPNVSSPLPSSHPGLSATKSTGSTSSGLESDSAPGVERLDSLEAEDGSAEAENFLAKHVDFEVPLFQVRGIVCSLLSVDA